MYEQVRRLRRNIARWFAGPTRLISVGDYNAYLKAQNAGNARKLNRVFAKEANIAYLASYIGSRLGEDVRILCHGTRNGAELGWFKQYLPHARVLGTEIADTATQFPDTIQWDFHDMKDDWIGAWDVVYSNSWDHAFDPEKAFRNWMNCLAPRGLMVLEHSRDHTPESANELDPFGARLTALVDMLNKLGKPRHRVVDVIFGLPDQSRDNRLVVVANSGTPQT